MRDVYLNFRLPWPAKIAAGMLTPGKWRPFEYHTTTWTAPYFNHTYLGFPSIKSNGFFTKTNSSRVRIAVNARMRLGVFMPKMNGRGFESPYEIGKVIQ
jgi:hypothetical protein